MYGSRLRVAMRQCLDKMNNGITYECCGLPCRNCLDEFVIELTRLENQEPSPSLSGFHSRTFDKSEASTSAMLGRGPDVLDAAKGFSD